MSGRPVPPVGNTIAVFVLRRLDAQVAVTCPFAALLHYPDQVGCAQRDRNRSTGCALGRRRPAGRRDAIGDGGSERDGGHGGAAVRRFDTHRVGAVIQGDAEGAGGPHAGAIPGSSRGLFGAEVSPVMTRARHSLTGRRVDDDAVQVGFGRGDDVTAVRFGSDLRARVAEDLGYGGVVGVHRHGDPGLGRACVLVLVGIQPEFPGS